MSKITKLSASVLLYYFFFFKDVYGDTPRVLYITSIICVFSVLLYCFQQGSIELTNVPFGVWNNLIMVVYALLTGVFVSYNYFATISGCVTYAAFSTVCISICYISAEEGSLEWLLKVLISLAVVCAVYTLFRGYEWRGYGRTLSETNNPHLFAAVMYLGIFSVGFIRRNKERTASIASAAFIALFYYSIIECGSRKYMLAGSCLVLIWMVVSIKEVLRNSDILEKIILFVGCAVFVALALYLFQRVFYQSNIYVRLNEMDDPGNQHRILYYKEAWEIFLKHPLFGGGYDQFKYLSGAGAYAHSTYAEAIADFGFLGCMIYFPPIIYASGQALYRAFIDKRDYASMLLAALCISELFLGAGQIFFMGLGHILLWMILFFYLRPSPVLSEVPDKKWKYIRSS